MPTENEEERISMNGQVKETRGRVLLSQYYDLLRRPLGPVKTAGSL